MKPALTLSIFLPLNVSLNHMIIYKNLNCNSQRNLYIRPLLTEICGWGDLRVAVKQLPDSLNGDLIY